MKLLKVIKWIIMILLCIIGGIIIGSLELACPWNILAPFGLGIIVGIVCGIVFDWLEKIMS